MDQLPDQLFTPWLARCQANDLIQISCEEMTVLNINRWDLAHFPFRLFWFFFFLLSVGCLTNTKLLKVLTTVLCVSRKRPPPKWETSLSVCCSPEPYVNVPGRVGLNWHRLVCLGPDWKWWDCSTLWPTDVCSQIMTEWRRVDAQTGSRHPTVL